MRTRPTTEGPLSIGKTVAILREEFPDVSVSKLRFLEAEGLVVPLRTPSGYRKYTDVQVERLRYVLSMQREHYLPLRVIAEHLDALDRGLQPPDVATTAPTVPSSAHTPPVTVDLSDHNTGVRLTPAELSRDTGLAPAHVAEAMALGLLPETTSFDLNHVEMARCLAQLSERGLSPRHLRPVILAATREIDLVQTAVGAQRRGESDVQFSDRHAELMHQVGVLHVTMLRQALAVPERAGTH